MTALVFAVSFALLWLRLGHWFYLSIDEGIYLEGARRVASGQVPYRDFFALTGPGTFWLYGAVFHWFGISLAAARAVLCCELAALCAGICSMTRRFANTAFAGGCGVLFLAMLLSTPYPLYITHRWDSNTLLLLALVCIARQWFAAGGICAGLAIWITPPMLIAAFATALFLERESIRHFAAGVAAPTLAAAFAVVRNGAGSDMLRTLVWDSSHYATANRLSYGALTGNFAAYLPPAAAILCLVLLLRKHPTGRFFRLLAGAAAASLLACYPRFGAAQLLFGSGFFAALLSCGAAFLIPRRAWNVAASGLLAAAVIAIIAGWPHEALARIETPVGTLNVSRRHHIMLNDLQSVIRPGDSLFVYPYLPALYFVLGAQNPTRYSFFQPGMMGPHDVESALADLRAHPPRWIVRHDFNEEFILKNWPSSDRSLLRYPDMESFFESGYHEANPDGVTPVGYRLLERNP